MGKLPSIHLYPGDWLRDSVSGCSLAAQGLWLRMMFVAHDAPNYGEIFARGLLAAESQIARRCGCSVEDFSVLFEELIQAGVPAFRGDIVYSRRMVRDASLRAVRVKSGRKGGLAKAKQKASKHPSKRLAKGYQNTEDDNDNDNDNETEDVIEEEDRSGVADSFSRFWSLVPKKVGRRAAEKGYRNAVTAIAGRAGPGGDNPHGFLAERMAAFAASDKGRSGQFCPHPATWLNEGRYDDDEAAWQSHRQDPLGTFSAAEKFLARDQRNGQ